MNGVTCAADDDNDAVAGGRMRKGEWREAVVPSCRTKCVGVAPCQIARQDKWLCQQIEMISFAARNMESASLRVRERGRAGVSWKHLVTRTQKLISSEISGRR